MNSLNDPIPSGPDLILNYVLVLYLAPEEQARQRQRLFYDSCFESRLSVTGIQRSQPFFMISLKHKAIQRSVAGKSFGRAKRRCYCSVEDYEPRKVSCHLIEGLRGTKHHLDGCSNGSYTE